MATYYTSENRIVDPSQCIGKTITSITTHQYANSMSLQFSDGTFLYVRIEQNFGDASTLDFQALIDMFSAKNVGLITPDQYNAWLLDHHEEYKRSREKTIIDRYHKSKEEYEDLIRSKVEDQDRQS